jgi:hypothetical protein
MMQNTTLCAARQVPKQSRKFHLPTRPSKGQTLPLIQVTIARLLRHAVPSYAPVGRRVPVLIRQRAQCCMSQSVVFGMKTGHGEFFVKSTVTTRNGPHRRAEGAPRETEGAGGVRREGPHPPDPRSPDNGGGGRTPAIQAHPGPSTPLFWKAVVPQGRLGAPTQKMRLLPQLFGGGGREERASLSTHRPHPERPISRRSS